MLTKVADVVRSGAPEGQRNERAFSLSDLIENADRVVCKNCNEMYWHFVKRNTSIWAQCLICGEPIIPHALPKKDIPDSALVDISTWDEQLRTDCRNRRFAAWKEDKDKEREKQKAEWDEWYQQYLLSDEWHHKRCLVLQRDKTVCRGCLRSGAEVIHHLTYDHVGDELLFELVALCRACHERIHKC